MVDLVCAIVAIHSMGTRSMPIQGLSTNNDKQAIKEMKGFMEMMKTKKK